MKYRKKPVIIDAVEITEGWIDNPYTTMAGLDQIGFGMSRSVRINIEARTVSIDTLEGVMTCNVGDYIIRGVKGEFYPCRRDIFELTYEAV